MDKNEIVRGGQGREPQEVIDDAWWFGAFMVLSVVVLVVALVATCGSVTP